MEKINIAELLKDCPKGMELDCTIYDNVEFEGISDNKDWPIAISVEGYPEVLNPYGCISYRDYTKCVIFPKGKTTWEGFVPPCKFKDGDIVYIETKRLNHNKFIIIFNEIKNDYIHKYACFAYQTLYTDKNDLCHLVDIEEMRLATEEEKQRLFQAIKDNGYKWNEETKTLEKLVEPKFKVKDRIKFKYHERSPELIVKIKDNGYILSSGKTLMFQDEDAWELYTNKFDITTLKPYDKVLVRDNNEQIWTIDYFSFIDDDKRTCSFICIGHYADQCIPYEGNEHLLGTTNDCDEYYKTWK